MADPVRDITSEDLVFEDARVLLRPLAHHDVLHLVPFSIHEPELWQFGLMSPSSEELLRHYIDSALADRAAGRAYPFIVYDKAARAYAGASRFYDISVTSRSTLLGYTWYGKAFQRTGLNTHCKFLLLSFAFDAWGIERVEFRTDAQNVRSREALRRLGAHEEGVLRSHSPKPQGGRRDTAVLSIVRADWESGVKEALRKKLVSGGASSRG